MAKSAYRSVTSKQLMLHLHQMLNDGACRILYVQRLDKRILKSLLCKTCALHDECRKFPEGTSFIEIAKETISKYL